MRRRHVRVSRRCIGDKAATIDGKPFDSLTGQIEKNGDRGKHLSVKMDVEGAEWNSLLATSHDVLGHIDQLIMELHGVNEAKSSCSLGS